MTKFRAIRRRLAVTLAAGLAVSAAAVHAQQGDAQAGKTKALPCMGCHAIDGYNNVYPTYHVPRLGGQHEAYLVAAMMAYKSGQRDHETMVAQASTLSDQDMKDIAAYFASLAK